jgi:hypothetical protein
MMISKERLIRALASELLIPWKMGEPPGEGTGPTKCWDSCKPGALTRRFGFIEIPRGCGSKERDQES